MAESIVAVILGAVQGLTEFLPVSSSGHLVFFQTLLGWSNSDANLYFDIILHVGTLVAVILVLKRPLINILFQLKNCQFHSSLLLAVATIPAIFSALFFSSLLTSLFSGGWTLSLAFVVSAVFLLISQQLDRPQLSGNWQELSYPQALLIGCFQAFALVPGVSRSGSTFLAGLFTGLDSQQSYTFSFLLAIPAIMGALVYQLLTLPFGFSVSPAGIIFGFASALIFGIIGLKLWDKIIVKQKYWVLAVYLVALAITHLIV